MDLKSFLRSKQKNVDLHFDDEKEQKAQSLYETAAQYEGKSQGELMQELMKEVEKGKKDGSFSRQKLEAFMQSAAPMLTPEARQKMEEIAKKL